MRVVTNGRLARSAFLAVLVAASVPTRADDAPDRPALEATVHPISWLVAEKGKWSGWSVIGRSVTVEGRVSFRTATRLRMRNCPLEFVSEKGEQLPPLLAEAKNVEIAGRFAKRGNDVVIVVDKLTSGTDDETRFRTRQAGLKVTDPDEWYELAEWAEERGTFYEDEKLLALAATTREGGLRAEERTLDPKDVDGLLALAAKAEKLGFPDRLVDEYRHRAWRLRWSLLDNPTAPPDAEVLAAFLKDLSKAYPDATKPPKPNAGERDPLDASLREYARSPVKTYATAADAVRGRLERAFYAEVEVRRLLAGLNPKGGNEEEIAKLVEQRLPELASVARDLRRRALDREVTNVASLTRAEMTALADRLRKGGEPGRASKVLADWLAAKEETLRTDGADGLIQAADYYESLTGDEDKVAQLLIEAHALAPQSQEIASRLEKLGYTRRGNTWTTVDGRDRPDRRPRDAAVTPGMSPERVVEILGAPRSKSRIATDGQVSEVWIYGARGASGFAIHFLRKSRVPEDEGQVVKVSERRPR